MPRPVDSAPRGAQVNVLKKVRTDKGWRFCPVVREANGRLRDRVRVGNRIEIHSEGVYYIEWRKDGRRLREAVPNPAAVLERARLKSLELDNWSQRTEWHNLVAYGRTAEIVRDYVSKGTQLFIQGKIQTHSWDDKESGQKRYRTEIFVHDLTLLGGGRGENGGSAHSNGRDSSRRTAGGSGYQPQQMDEQYSDEELNPDEIPF
jgi:single-strand DNA-binding protein